MARILSFLCEKRLVINKMKGHKYVKLDEVNPEDVLTLLNNHRIREHLIDHEMFDLDSVKAWIKEKTRMDSTRGCKVRGLISKNAVIGWCGIQLEQGQYEIAIVLDNTVWGIGKRVFIDMMGWAKALDHDEVLIHFHHTRPEYKFLRKISNEVFETELLGSQFTTYRLSVDKGLTLA